MQKSYAIKDTFSFLDLSSREYVLTIRDLPLEEKPREKMLRQGPESLSTKELLAVVLSTGTIKEDVLEMSGRIIREYGEKSILSERNPAKLSEETSIPMMKASQIVAVGELGRRFYDRAESGFTVIRSAKDAYMYLQDMRNLPKEHLRGLYLNSHNKIIRDEVISIGTVNSSIIHPRDIFRPAIECNAVALVLAHNHPSGEASPSHEDMAVTNQIIEAGKIVGITLLDHIIIAKDAFISIKANY